MTIRERLRLLLRVWFREWHGWWRSRRWVRRRIIRRRCRRFIPFDGMHDEVLELSNAPGAVIRSIPERSVFPLPVVPGPSAIEAQRQRQREAERYEFEQRTQMQLFQLQERMRSRDRELLNRELEAVRIEQKELREMQGEVDLDGLKYG